MADFILVTDAQSCESIRVNIDAIVLYGRSERYLSGSRLILRDLHHEVLVQEPPDVIDNKIFNREHP